MTCKYCQILPRDTVASNKLARAVRVGFHSRNGRLVIVPRRHVASWGETSTEEKLALLELLDHLGDGHRGAPICYSISFDIGPPVKHLQVQVVPKSGEVGAGAGAGSTPMETSPLSTGGMADPFLAHLEPLFAGATDIAILAAFVQDSGVYELQDQLR